MCSRSVPIWRVPERNPVRSARDLQCDGPRMCWIQQNYRCEKSHVQAGRGVKQNVAMSRTDGSQA